MSKYICEYNIIRVSILQGVPVFNIVVSPTWKTNSNTVITPLGLRPLITTKRIDRIFLKVKILVSKIFKVKNLKNGNVLSWDVEPAQDSFGTRPGLSQSTEPEVMGPNLVLERRFCPTHSVCIFPSILILVWRPYPPLDPWVLHILDLVH